MQPFYFALAIAASLFLSACGENGNTPTNSANTNKDTVTPAPEVDHQASQSAITTHDIIAGYLALKNALADDKGKEAAEAANTIKASIEGLNDAAFNADQKKTYADVKDDIKEHAEHIASNSNNISHQREHFDIMSQDMIDLVKATGSHQTLYKDYCPMYNNNKGAAWLSETKEIKNPYLGKKMPTCGEVKEEIKPKG